MTTLTIATLILIPAALVYLNPPKWAGAAMIAWCFVLFTIGPTKGRKK